MNTAINKRLVFAVVGVANFVAPFSVNSITLALPLIEQEFGVTQKDISWLALVYSLIPSCTLLLFGRTAELYGYKRQFKLGFLFFGVLCAITPILSTSANILVFFRCLQGLAYAIIISITQAIISLTFDKTERGKALGINAVLVSVGLAAGPSIGGLLLRYFSWHAVFYFNVPFCLLGYLVASRFLPDDNTEASWGKSMDWIGALLFSVSIGAVTVGLNMSGIWGIMSFRFVMCALLGVFGFILFVKREKGSKSPMMDLDAFKNVSFSAANTISLLSYLVQQQILYLVPYYLINVLLLPANRSGLLMLTQPAFMMLVSSFAGRLADKKGSRLPIYAGLILTCVSCIMLSMLGEASSNAAIVFCLALCGAGNGMVAPPVNAAIFNSAPEGRAGITSGMVATVRNLGQALGVVCGSAIVTSRVLFYENGQGQNAAYLLAQRDAYFFGVFVIIAALLLTRLLPKSSKSKAGA